MIIQHAASSAINHIVDTIWYVEEAHLEARQQRDVIMPSGQVHIVYNFAEPYYLIEKDYLKRIPDRVLVGPMTQVAHIRYSNQLHQLGMALKPTALYQVFQIHSAVYTGAMVDCTQFDSMRELHALVQHSITRGDRVQMTIEKLENYFKCAGHHTEQSIVEAVVDYIDLHKGVIDVSEMAQCFYCSVSTLERQFKRHVGLSPKTYANILRFRYAVLAEDPPSLYYDQSHYIKHCKKYTTKIPSDMTRAEELSLLYMLNMK